MIDSRTFFFCLLRLQQNHRRTERIESATTPLTTPAMIGTTGLFEDDCPTGIGEDVVEAKAPAIYVVWVDVGVTTVEVTDDTEEGGGVTVAVAVVSAEFDADVLDGAPFEDTELDGGGVLASGHHGIAHGSTEQQPLK